MIAFIPFSGNGGAKIGKIFPSPEKAVLPMNER